MDYRAREVSAQGSNYSSITYVVAFDGTIIFTRELTRHFKVQQRSGYEYDDIIWGGVLSAEGKWVRKSYDFGDAPTYEDRMMVVELINKAMR